MKQRRQVNPPGSDSNKLLNKPKKRVKKYIVLYVFALSALVVFLLLSLPVFNVSDIIVNGLSEQNKVNRSYVIQECGFYDNNGIKSDKPQNIFLINTKKIKKKLLVNPYIKKAEIKKSYPNTLVVNITERRVSCYVESSKGTFLYIGDDGIVLEAASSFTEKLPVLVGLKNIDYTVGAKLDVENKRAFEDIVVLTNIFNRYEIDSSIYRISIANESDVRLYIYNIEVYFGSVEDADEKIRNMVEQLKEIPDAADVKGILYLNTKPYRFKLIT